MIYKNGKLILDVSKNVSEVVDQIQQIIEHKIGAVYRGSQLVWMTFYNAIKSCFGSGIWLSTKPWIDDDIWKNN